LSSTQLAGLPQARAVSEHIVPDLRSFAVERTDLVRTAFLTGSYISGRWRRERPNLNVYFIAASERAVDLRWALGNFWADLRGRLAADEVELLLDCHPFTMSQRPPESVTWPLVTVTSKVLAYERADRRYDLPPTIGPGWAANFEVLVGDADDVLLLKPSPSADEEWVRTVHSALSRYRGILDHLPWALTPTIHGRYLLEESARYAEEAFKDSLSLRLSPAELSGGMHVTLLDGWQTSSADHVAERFGTAGVAAAQRVTALKAAVAEPGPVSAEDAEAWWRSALSVWDWAWSEFREVAGRIVPDAPELARVDAFI
jgi:hypothetical protein